MTVIMLDGIAPDVPAIHAAIYGRNARYPGAAVNSYVNGGWAWSRAQEAEFGRKIRTSVEPGQPEAAKVARCLDVEPGAAGPGDVRPFLSARKAAGHDDATIYCNLSTAPAANEHEMDVPRWWLAWYWGQPFAPTAAQVVAELHRLTGMVLDPARLWACQWVSHASYDVSVVYGTPDFSR